MELIKLVQPIRLEQQQKRQQVHQLEQLFELVQLQLEPLHERFTSLMKPSNV
jgi:hypothetical protein